LNGAEQKGWTEREKETPQTPRNRPAVEATADTSLSAPGTNPPARPSPIERRAQQGAQDERRAGSGRRRTWGGEETADVRARARVLPLRRQRKQVQVAAPEQETAAKISRFSIVQVSRRLRARRNSGDWQVRRGEWVVGLAARNRGVHLLMAASRRPGFLYRVRLRAPRPAPTRYRWERAASVRSPQLRPVTTAGDRFPPPPTSSRRRWWRIFPVRFRGAPRRALTVSPHAPACPTRR